MVRVKVTCSASTSQVTAPRAAPALAGLAGLVRVRVRVGVRVRVRARVSVRAGLAGLAGFAAAPQIGRAGGAGLSKARLRRVSSRPVWDPVC